jgi:hypothetical protein
VLCAADGWLFDLVKRTDNRGSSEQWVLPI